MATLFRSATLRPSPSPSPSPSLSTSISPFHASYLVNFKPHSFTKNTCLYAKNSLSKLPLTNNHFPKFLLFASSEESTTETEEIQQSDTQSNTDGVFNGETVVEEASEDAQPNVDEASTSCVITALQLYKEAVSNNDESKVAELEAFIKSIEDEKDMLEKKVASMSEDLSVERDRVIRISADFDNFRKRTDRERSSLVSNAQGEVIENFLGVLDNFERAKSQLKIESEAEEKINNSYQSIYKQFVEILGSIGVVPVETVGKPFDPLLHEAILREESTLYDDGVVIEEYRKGFKLGDRLLRPSMVKVSAGPGPGKHEVVEDVQEEDSTVDLKNQSTP